MDQNKEKIINLFNMKIKGKLPDVSASNTKHDGKEGHWLETEIGIKHNSNNDADLYGYEMKNQTTSGKITFGDWSADEYIFLHGRGNKINNTNKNYKITRNDFFDFFGKPNPEKDNRLSWSGQPCPTYYNQITDYGQLLTIDNNNDIVIIYNYNNDKRPNKDEIMPSNMKIDNLIIAKWKKESLKLKLEKKFNQKGWFTCTKNKNGLYENIKFGKAMNFETWFQLFKDKVVFFDSGMYKGNNRPYSQWRASTTFWHTLIIDTY